MPIIIRRNQQPQVQTGNRFLESLRAGFDPAYTPRVRQPSGILDKLIGGAGHALGALPSYMAGTLAGQAAIPIPFLGAAVGMGGVGAARETYRQARSPEKGIEDPTGILKQGLIDAVLGSVLHGAGKFPLKARVPVAAGVGGGTSALMGGDMDDVTANAILMGLMSTPGGRRPKMPEIAKRTPVDMPIKKPTTRVGGLTPDQARNAPAYQRNKKGMLPQPKAEPVDLSKLTGNQRLAIENLMKARGRPKPIPGIPETVKPGVAKQVEFKPDIPVTEKAPSIMEQFKTKVKRSSPLSKESEKIETYGRSGKEMVNRGRKAFALLPFEKTKLQTLYKSLDIENMTPKEVANLHLAVENKAVPINGRVANAMKAIDVLKREVAREHGFDVNESYVHRRLNEAGMEHYKIGGEPVKQIAKKMGKSEYEIYEMFEEGTPRGGFEYSRVLKEIPDKYRDYSAAPIEKWFNDIARSRAQVKAFGTDNRTLKRLAGDIIGQGKTMAEQKAIKKSVDSYMEKVTGKFQAYSDIGPALGILRAGMMTKLTPLTTVANEFQAHVASYLKYGTKGLSDTMLRDGGKLAKEVGLDSLRGKIGSQLPAESFVSKYVKAIGLASSEQRGISRTAGAIDGAISRAWESVKRNPNDPAALKTFENLAMFVDEGSLAKALKSGDIPAAEKAVGLIRGTQELMFINAPGERPAWATSQAGSVAYIFHHYLLEQMRLLRSAPLHRQVAYLAVISPMLGIPMLTLRRALQGKDLPEDPADWYTESAKFGPGSPLELLQPLSSERDILRYIAGGFYGPIDMGLSVKRDLERKEPSAKSTVTSGTYNLPLPLSTVWGPRMLKKLYPKKKSGGGGGIVSGGSLGPPSGIRTGPPSIPRGY